LRLTAKHVGGAVVVVGRAIAWKAIDASSDDTVNGIVDVMVNVLAVLAGRVPVNLLKE